MKHYKVRIVAAGPLTYFVTVKAASLPMARMQVRGMIRLDAYGLGKDAKVAGAVEVPA